MTLSWSIHSLNLILLLVLLADQTAAQGDGVPWDGPRAISDNLPPRELSSPAQLLPFYGIDADQLASLADGEPVEGGERQTLIRILFRMPQVPLRQLEEWAAQGPSLAAVLAAPTVHRGYPLRVSGFVRRIEAERVPLNRPGVGFSVYYRVDLETDSGVELQVFTREIPSSWKNTVPTGTPAEATALFLKLGANRQLAPLICVAPRIAWFPDRADDERGVTEDHVWLSRLGMDLGLFDAVRLRNRKSIDGHDRECFYQLLAAVGRADVEEFANWARSDFELAPLLQQPEQYHGRLLTVGGTARRVTRIVVADQEIRQRFGIDHYFQIDLFVPLGKQVVRLGRPTDDKDSPTFVNSYPVTVCVRELPADLPEGDDLREEIRISAAYFKLWAYRSRFVASYDQRQLQIGPMLIGRKPLVIHRQPSSSRYAGAGLAAVFLIALTGIWFWVWQYNREDSSLSQRTLRRRLSIPDGESLDDLGLEAEHGPDFSGLTGGAGQGTDPK